MSAEAWIALVALALPVIGGVAYGCVQFAFLRRDVSQIKSNDLPHIFNALQKLPCRGQQPRPCGREDRPREHTDGEH